MINNVVDLHIHTTKSDGTKTPTEVLTEAEQLGLKRISVTDHESVDAYPEIAENRNSFSGVIVPGIELKTHCRGREIELLGYGFSIEEMKKNLPQFYQPKEQINKNYLSKIIETLKRNGIIIKDGIEEEYDGLSTQPAWFIRSILNSDKENIEYNMKLLNQDVIEHPKTDGFYRGWLSNPASKFFVDFQAYPSFEDTIKLIKNSGGKVFIPHIFQYGDRSKGILQDLLATGKIDGIECYYPTFSKEQTKYLLDICSTQGLFVSGGSDYHGTNKKNELGRGLDSNLYVPEEKVINWTNMLSKNVSVKNKDIEEESICLDM